MADLKWIKLTIDLFEDEKINYIETLPEANAIILIWVRLLCMAGKCNNHGFIYLTEKIPYNEELLAHKMKQPISIVRAALKLFENLEMVEVMQNGYLSVVNWEKHQSIDRLDKIRLNDKERKRRDRALAKELALPQGQTQEQVPGRELEQQNERMSMDMSVDCPTKVQESPDTDEDEELDIDISSSSCSKSLIENLLLQEQFVLPKNPSRTIEKWLSYDIGIVRLAILEASDNGKINGLGYVTRLLNIWDTKGLNTPEKIENNITEWTKRTDLKKTNKPKVSEKVGNLTSTKYDQDTYN